MTYDQYWYGDVSMVGAFRKAERLRQERVDAEQWLQGVYFMNAIQATIGNVFLKKNATPISYPEIPMIAAKKERVAKERQAEREERDRAFARMWMTQMVEAGKNWGKKP